jgi:carboxypeptidase Q
MKFNFFYCLFVFNISFSFAQENDSILIRKIYSHNLTNSNAYENLRELCKGVGNRLSGSENAEKAVKWAFEKLKSEKSADTVYLQEVKVPVWKRYKEEAVITKNKQKLAIYALGGSVSTPENGITSNLIEVRNYEELDRIPNNEIKGKIVFINHQINKTNINTFDSYRESGKYRWRGASEAGAKGAAAVIVKSLTLKEDDEPHTGSMSYIDSLVKIPAAAISWKSAEILSNAIKQDKNTQVQLILKCETLKDVVSYNVIAELKGSLYPNEIIVAGGHLDSWDKGEGAHDDGTGVVQSFEILRTFKSLNIKPERTIRVVAFMNEENGLRGGKKLAEISKIKKEKIIAGLESDAGGFSPRGFFMEGTEEQVKKVKALSYLFTPYNLHSFNRVGSGSDVEPLKDFGALLMELEVDSQRYFDLHHTSNDVFEQVNKRELELGSASMAAMVYLLSRYGL